MAAPALTMPSHLREESAVTFKIGPRENVKTFEVPAHGPHPGYKAEAHQRVINGTTYLFGRYAYETGQVAVQVLIRGRSAKGNPDIHYWTNGEVGA